MPSIMGIILCTNDIKTGIRKIMGKNANAHVLDKRSFAKEMSGPATFHFSFVSLLLALLFSDQIFFSKNCVLGRVIYLCW